jgi:riboflavin kinase/FMN adenylyltransferase
VNANELSSLARNALAIGNIRLANEFIGRPYSIGGRVIHGNHLGKSFGFPTANLEIPTNQTLIVINGVYVVTVKYEDKLYPGMANVGTRPTIDGKLLKIEVNLFDFNEDLYGKSIQVFFLDRLRDEKKFSGIEALINQIRLDKERTLLLLSRLNYPDPNS